MERKMIKRLVNKLDLRDISIEIISARKNLKLGFMITPHLFT